MTKLQEEFRTRVSGELKETLGLSNVMQVPQLQKIVVSVGVKATERDSLQGIMDGLAQITGQTPMLAKAKKSISNFKLREGMSIGAKVTLRGTRMYDFLERFVSAALPRIRDFRGIPRSGFDGRGNYNMGIDDQTIFPEIDPDEVKVTHGMNIAFVTSAKTDEQCLVLLQKLGMPFAES